MPIPKEAQQKAMIKKATNSKSRKISRPAQNNNSINPKNKKEEVYEFNGGLAKVTVTEEIRDGERCYLFTLVNKLTRVFSQISFEIDIVKQLGKFRKHPPTRLISRGFCLLSFIEKWIDTNKMFNDNDMKYVDGLFFIYALGLEYEELLDNSSKESMHKLNSLIVGGDFLNYFIDNTCIDLGKHIEIDFPKLYDYGKAHNILQEEAEELIKKVKTA